MSILGLVAVSLFGALFARLYYLQVMEAPQFQVAAQANRSRTITEEAPRGRILDVEGRVLVDNRTSLVVTVDRPALDTLTKAETEDLKLRLAQTITDFGVPTKVKDVDSAINDQRFDPLQPVPVAIDVPEPLLIYIAEKQDDFPGVTVKRESVRRYPDDARNSTGNPVAAHLLGYVGPINQDELDAKQGNADPATLAKPYQMNSEIGKGGVEQAYEDDLRGTPGTRVIEVDAHGDPVRTVSYQPPIPGNDVQLTVDLDTQKIAEQALAEQLDEQRGKRYTDVVGTPLRAKSPAGATAVVDPSNGAVRAMASYPTYDPSEFVNGISQRRYDELTKGDPATNGLINRALQGQYAPGSTFKPFTAFAAVQAGLITTRETVVDDGVYERADKNDKQVFRNAKSQAHGSVDLARSLTVSSDWYYYALGDLFWLRSETLGENAQMDGYAAFGFGAPTGIPIPGEAKGNVPNPTWKQNLFDSMSSEDQANGDPSWLPGDQINMAVGQGDILVTPLQLANAYATLANGGTVHQPQVALRILQPGATLDALGNPTDPASVLRTIDPVVVRQVTLPPGFLDSVTSGLEGVVTSADGTAHPTFDGFDLTDFPIAGKTGTAEVKGKVDSSWFAAFGPVGAPRYAAAAVLEQSGNGADGGAPVVRRIYEQVSGQDQTSAGDIAGGSE